MWLLGMIVGAVLGSIGGLQGALAGAMIGSLVGAARQRHAPAVDEAWKRSVDERLRQLQRRVLVLERSHHATSTEQAAATDAVRADTAPPAVTARPAPTTPPRLVAPLATGTRVPGDTAPAPAPIPDASITETSTVDPLVRWLLGDNALVRVGVLVLFFGVAFLLKFVAERDIVPLELRLAGVAAGGAALLLVGWRLRTRRAGYALMLQGGGVGILYLTVFAAFRLYQMLPATLAFGLLAGIAAFSAVLAVAQDARLLAITGTVGGFLAPILASTGGGSHVTLFGFYALLNTGIVGIAYHKAWRELNLIGFVFTFIVGLAWGSQYYRPELFSSTEPFLVLFFLFYVTIAVLFATRQTAGPDLGRYVDGTIVFGTPLVAFGLQVALVRDMEFGAAWSALAAAALYLALASVLHARRRESGRLLAESFLALGVGFATLAVPLALDARWTSAVWAVEGAAILWAGGRQGRLLPRVFGLLLQPAAGVAFLVDVEGVAGTVPILNSLYLGCVLLSVAGLFCSYDLEHRRESITALERRAAPLLFVWGMLWWFGGGLAEIHRHTPAAWSWHPHLLFFAATCAVFGVLWRRLNWEMARYAALALLPLMAVVICAGIADRSAWHPFAGHAYVGWLLAFGVHLRLLRLHEARPEERTGEWLDGFHAAGVWLLAVILSWEVSWQIDRYVPGQGVWPLIAWALVPAALIAALVTRAARPGWPVSVRRSAYLYGGALPLAIFLLGWILYASFGSDGDPAPLPYVPLLNPLDLAQAGALLAVVTWYVSARRVEELRAKLPDPLAASSALGAVLFFALNGVLLRTLHHYANVPFHIDAMWRSNLVQACLSLFWSVIALAAMAFATRRRLRMLWTAGAALLAVVVAKLFLVDLANTGTVERVVSFVGVGILVIVIGYFSPAPPKSREKEV